VPSSCQVHVQPCSPRGDVLTCSTKPIWRRTALVRRCPLTVMDPAVSTNWGTRPPMELRRVVLPLPEGPYSTAQHRAVSR
jgi:hypothetical protein